MIPALAMMIGAYTIARLVQEGAKSMSEKDRPSSYAVICMLASASAIMIIGFYTLGFYLSSNATSTSADSLRPSDSLMLNR